MISRHVKLSKEERLKLVEIWNKDSVQQTKKRAHALLLSDSGENIDTISKIFFVNRNTLSAWLTRWEENGFAGLYDASGRGRRPIFNKEEEKKY